MRFYVGLHQPSDAQHFDRCMVSARRVRRFRRGRWCLRRCRIPCREVFLDSGAFKIIEKYGCYPEPPQVYAGVIQHAAQLCGLVAASTEDYMCEPYILDITGLTVADHQRLTIERYDTLRALVPHVYILPVLQGYRSAEYVQHITDYGERLPLGAWVGVGSVCKRNGRIDEIERVLVAIKAARPDLRLHGFGVKTTALESDIVRDCLYSADSVAWSLAARKQGRNQNDWREAMQFYQRIVSQRVVRRPGVQLELL